MALSTTRRGLGSGRSEVGKGGSVVATCSALRGIVVEVSVVVDGEGDFAVGGAGLAGLVVEEEGDAGGEGVEQLRAS
jgi:hypothetical protein